MSNKKPPSKKYNYARLKDAYDAVTKHNFKIRAAARIHGVPESTIRLRLSQSNDSDVKLGGPTLFSKFQEEQLAGHCIAMANIGYGFARWQILNLARNMCQIIGIEAEPGNHWFYNFVKRFPELSMVTPKKRDKERDVAITGEMLENYFQQLKDVLTRYDLMNKPAHIWNIDETGISLDHSPPKILARKGSDPHCITNGKSATTTVIAAGSALGETIPPYIIFKGERLSTEMTSNGMPGSEYRSSSTGWSNSVLFLDFFRNHFLHHISTRPCILFYDGHSTHVTVEVIETARSEGVHLFVLPPHSSHCLQPLDVSVFSSFKQCLNSEFHKYLHAHPNKNIMREDLPHMISLAYKSSLTVSNIMSGFRKTGIFPYCPTAVPTNVTSTITSTTKEVTPKSRKMRKNDRSIKVLFQEKLSEFKELKENTKPKKERKKFVPPFGAVITEDEYYLERKHQHDQKAEKEEKKAINRKKKFVTPYSNQSQSSSITCNINVTEESEKYVGNGKGKSKGNKSKGKGPCKRQKCNQKSIGSDLDSNNENCVVCGKWQPEGLNLHAGIKFVNWGQCTSCNRWMHLEFCCNVTSLSESDDFICPKCNPPPEN